MDKQNLDDLRHSCAHLLAAAVLDIYPDAKRTIGPAIEDGFYYDFDFGTKKFLKIVFRGSNRRCMSWLKNGVSLR